MPILRYIINGFIAFLSIFGSRMLRTRPLLSLRQRKAIPGGCCLPGVAVTAHAKTRREVSRGACSGRSAFRGRAPSSPRTAAGRSSPDRSPRRSRRSGIRTFLKCLSSVSSRQGALSVKIALRFPRLFVCLSVRPHLSRAQYYVMRYYTTAVYNCTNRFWRLVGQDTATEYRFRLPRRR